MFLSNQQNIYCSMNLYPDNTKSVEKKGARGFHSTSLVEMQRRFIQRLPKTRRPLTVDIPSERESQIVPPESLPEYRNLPPVVTPTNDIEANAEYLFVYPADP